MFDYVSACICMWVYKIISGLCQSGSGSNGNEQSVSALPETVELVPPPDTVYWFIYLFV